MSRGLGRLQNAIIGHLQNNGPTTLESIRWKARESNSESDLTVSTHNAVKKAIEKLSSLGLLKLTERPLQSIEECIEHYPSKTLKSAVRNLRLNLLPALCEQSNCQNYLRYSLADNEKFHYLALTDEEKKAHFERWQTVERDLARALGNMEDSEQRGRLFCLYAKAKSIFEYIRVEVIYAFCELLEWCKAVLQPELFARIESVYRALISIERAGNLQMRTFVHTFVNVSSKGSCALKTDTIDHLYSVRRDYLESLPEFKPNPSSPRWMPRPHHFHDPILHKLFDQSVFQNFNFIESAA